MRAACMITHCLYLFYSFVKVIYFWKEMDIYKNNYYKKEWIKRGDHAAVHQQEPAL
jgi:hypothetical protein